MANKAIYKIMTMTLRVVVPPHPLISHWLTILRNSSTPALLYGTALEQVGRYLCYETTRDWIPYRKELVETKHGSTECTVIESRVPLIAICLNEGAFHLWQGSKEIIPNGNLCIGNVPEMISDTSGILLFVDEISSGEILIKAIGKLKQLNVESKRIRIITAIAASPGLKKIGETAPDLTIYTSCIDEELNDKNEVIPGIGEPRLRLNTRILSSH